MSSDKRERLTLLDLKPRQDDLPDGWENRSRDILRNQIGDEAFEKLEANNFKNTTDDLGFITDIGDKIKRTKFDLFTCSTLPPASGTEARGDPVPVGGFGLLKIVSNPAFPDHSFFQRARLIPVRLRHNNLSYKDDAMVDGRVAAIKFADKDQGGPCDLILHTGRTAQYHSAESFEQFVTAFRGGVDSLRNWCRNSSANYFGRVENLRKAPTSYYSLRYYSHVTYEFTSAEGATWLARFRLIPADGSTETGLLTAEEQENVWDPIRTNHAADYLRSEYNERLQAGAVQYRLQIQLSRNDVIEQLETDCGAASDGFVRSGRGSSSDAEQDDVFNHRPQTGRPFGSDARNACVIWDPESSPWLDFAIVTLTSRLPAPILSSTSFNLGNQLWSWCPLASKSTRDFGSLSLSVRGFHGIDPDRRIPDDPKIPRTEYRITTVTGTLINAGTDADINITITGSKGRTPPINLDQRFKNDFESGQRDDFFEEGPEVGQIVAIEMTLSSMFGNRRWYLEEVIVSDVRSDVLARFPCYQWLTSRQPHVMLLRGEAVTPHLEIFPVSYLLRKYELAIRRGRYKWHKEDGLPGRIDVNKYEELPKEARLHVEHDLNYYSKYLRTLANTGAGKLNTLLTKWDIFTDNPKLLTKFLKDGYKSITKKVIRDWESDEEFGRQILNGPHPVRIQKLSKLPEVLEPSREVIQGLMDRNISVDKAISEGYFYMLCYPELDNLERCTNYKGKHNRYITSPLCLLYVNKDGKCLPLAINLELDGPVWTPRDGATEWKFAKMWLRLADVQIHHVVSRHLHTQLVSETVAMAMFRNLATSHPVYKLLYPHLKYSLAVNVLDRQFLYPAEDGLFERILSVGGQHQRLIRSAYERFHVDDLHLPRSVRRRGVDDWRLLPCYWYRDDGLAVWGAVEKYIGTVLRLCYRNDDSVRADEELQAWIADLAENGLSGQTSGLSGRTSGLSGRASGLSGRDSGLSGRDSGLSRQTSAMSGQTSAMSRQNSTVSGQASTLSGHTGRLSGQTNGLSGSASDLSGHADRLSGHTSGPSGRASDVSEESFDASRHISDQFERTSDLSDGRSDHSEKTLASSDPVSDQPEASHRRRLSDDDVGSPRDNASQMSDDDIGHLSDDDDVSEPSDDVDDDEASRRQNHGVPSELTSLDDVIDYVTMFVFSASAQHAALSSGMMDYYSYVPNAPSVMTMPPPSSKAEVTPAYLKKALPSRGKTAEIIAACYTLSKHGMFEEYLNSFKEEYFNDEAIRQAQLAFKVDLERISETIQNRNKSLDIPYTYLIPENIPKTVSV